MDEKTPMFIEITPVTDSLDELHHRLVATDLIAGIGKLNDNASEITVLTMKDGSVLSVSESMKTLQARLGML